MGAIVEGQYTVQGLGGWEYRSGAKWNWKLCAVHVQGAVGMEIGLSK